MKGYNLPESTGPNDPEAPFNKDTEPDGWSTSPNNPKNSDRHVLDGDPYCEVCREWPENCVCPECPLCGEIGNPTCYQEVDLGVCGGLFGDENKR